MSSNLTQQQINDIYLSLFGTGITPSASDYATLETLSVNGAISAIIQSADVAAYDYPIIRIIEFVTGVAPNAIQLATWANFLETGGTLAQVVTAFAENITFQNVFNGGNLVDPNAAPTFNIMYNIIQHALSTNAAQNNYHPTTAQVDGWLATGLSTAQILAQFANGDQYSALTQPYIQSYLAQVAAVTVNNAGGAIGGVSHFPTGSLFGVGAGPITITDSTAPTESTTAGNTVTFTVSETGLPAGTQETWTLSGTAVTDGEVTSATSGTLTFNAAGTATVTVNTLYAGFSAAALTLTVGSAADTVSLNAPVILNYNGTPGQILTGGPENTIFSGVINNQSPNQNTFVSGDDAAQGHAGVLNSLNIVVETGSADEGLTILPGIAGATPVEDTNIQTLNVTDLAYGGSSSTNYWNLEYMPQLQTINSVGSENADTFFNVQNLVNVGVINSDSPDNGYITIEVINSVAPGAITVTLQSSNFGLAYTNTEGQDVVTAYNFVVSGDNYLNLFGSQITQSIRVFSPTNGDNGNSLWINFSADDNVVTNRDENKLYFLTSVDASGLTGATAVSDNYQFGFDSSGGVNIYQGANAGGFNFLGAQGNTYVDLNLEVANAVGTQVYGLPSNYVYDAQGGTFNIVLGGTATSGNNYVYIDSSSGNGETINVSANGTNTSNTTSGNGAGGDSVDLHGWNAINQKLSVTETGNGNNTVHVVSGAYATVNVNAMGTGNNTVDIDLWNNQGTAPFVQVDDGTSAQVTVNVGDGTNGVFVNTNKVGGNDNDEGSHVTVTAGNGINNEIVVDMGNDSTSNVTVGNGNGDSVLVETLGSDDGPYTFGTYATTSTINVGTGGTTLDPISVTYIDSNAALSATPGGNGGWENVTINVGLGGGGVGSIDATIGTHSTATVSVGDGNYGITVDMEGSYDTAVVTAGNGNNDIQVFDSLTQSNDLASITAGDGINQILVVFDETTASTVNITTNDVAQAVGVAGNEITVVLDDVANSDSSATISVGAGNNSIAVHGLGYGSDNTVNITGGNGSNWVYLGSLDTGAAVNAGISVALGTGYNTLALGSWAAVLSGAGPVAASLSGFSALELTSSLGSFQGVTVTNFGVNNNINQVIFDSSFGYDSVVSGLGNNAEIDLLWADNWGSQLIAPVGSSLGPNTVTASILLDSQSSSHTYHEFGNVVLHELFLPTSVGIVNLASTAAEGVDDSSGVTNHLSLDDAGITTVNLWSKGMPDTLATDIETAASGMTNGVGVQFHDGSNPSPADGGAIQDGDVYLNLDGSELGQDGFGNGGLTSFNATNATNGGHGDFLAGIEANFAAAGVTNAITFNANQTTLDDLTFGDANGNHIFVGNYQNSIDVGNGDNNVITLAQQTESVYSASAAGNNTVDIGNGIDNTINIDNNAPGDGNTVTVGDGSGGSTATNGDVINLGTGGNVSDSTINIKGDNSNADTTLGVPNAIDTININSSGGGNNTITPDDVTGSTINLGTHTLGDTIVFDDVKDSAFGFNDTLTGFVGSGTPASATGTFDLINLSAVDSGHTTSYYEANGALAALGLANSHGGTGHAVVVYDYTNGTLYDFVGTTGSNANASNTLEVQVGLIGQGHFTSHDVIL